MAYCQTISCLSFDLLLSFGIKIENGGIPFEKKMEEYSQKLHVLLKEEEELTKKVQEVFKALGWEI